jgi:cysteine desulfurase/selenocysteine lyase
VLVAELEHHANIVPWQRVCAEKGARLRAAPVGFDGQILLDEYERLFSKKTRFVSIAHVSNALGTVLPVREMIETAHRFGVPVCVDGAQSAAHTPINLSGLDADFFVFSGHKMYAPMGSGAVCGKKALWDEAEPWQGGGNMIDEASFEKTTYQKAPAKFEAGTANVAGAAGLAAALDYLSQIGMEKIAAHEQALYAFALSELQKVPGLRVIGNAAERAGALSFVMENAAPEEIGARLAKEGIALRAGHHCAQPVLRRFGLKATVRPSFGLYNTFGEIERLGYDLKRLL